jgi:hypothetical protein
MKKLKLTTVLFLMLMVSCKQETVVNSDDNTVPVDIDLQMGVENNYIKVYCNQRLSFQAYLSNSVPLSGPIATFSTYLNRNSNTVRVWWHSLSSSNGLEFKQDSSVFNLGTSDRYYIGIQIINDSLTLKVQDSQFGYL